MAYHKFGKGYDATALDGIDWPVNATENHKLPDMDPILHEVNRVQRRNENKKARRNTDLIDRIIKDLNDTGDVFDCQQATALLYGDWVPVAFPKNTIIDWRYDCNRKYIPNGRLQQLNYWRLRQAFPCAKLVFHKGNCYQQTCWPKK